MPPLPVEALAALAGFFLKPTFVGTIVTENDDPKAGDADEAKGSGKGSDTGDDFEEDQNVRYRLPDPSLREMFGIADQLLGASKMIVMCEDGKSRMGRIRGKMKRRMWIKPGDLVIVRPWDFQDDKADVVYRYIRTQSANLSRRGLIPELLDVGF